MSNSEIIHANYLHEWMKPKHYYEAGIRNLETIVSVIPEPIWYDQRNFQQHTLCDYIIMFEDKSAISAELKGSRKQRSKAKKQINAGRQYIEQVLNMDYRYGIFIVYNSYGYDHHRISREEL